MAENRTELTGETSEVPVATPTTPEASRAAEYAKTEAFLASWELAAGAVPTRIGNSNGGTTFTHPQQLLGGALQFPGGAPIRLSIPGNARRVGLEWAPDGDGPFLRIDSGWNEGGFHQTLVDPRTGLVVAGLFDFPFPLTADGSPAGTGFWQAIDSWHRMSTHEYRTQVPFVELRQGPDSGYPDYSWSYEHPGGLVIETPYGRLFGLVDYGSGLVHPDDPGMVFTQYHYHRTSWTRRGEGREQVSFGPTFSRERYPTDPRLDPHGHPGPIKLVKQGGELYMYSGNDEIMVHRWRPTLLLWEPVAALFVRPSQDDQGNWSMEYPETIPDHPATHWGTAALTKANGLGHFTGSWQTFPLPLPLWSGYLTDISPSGDIWFTPRWREFGGTDGAILTGFHPVHGMFSIDTLQPLVLPAVLKAAEECAQVTVDWKSGDLVAVVKRGGEWLLERYQNNRMVYSVGPVALSLRQDYHWSVPYDPRWNSSPNEKGQVPQAGFASMVVLEGFVFIAELQAGGVRIHRLSDGAPVRRVYDEEGRFTNSTVDLPTQFSVSASPSEFRIMVMDFHGKAILTWRVPKKSLVQ